MHTIVLLDRSWIKRRWKFNRGPLGRAGAYLMKIARTSIRRRKNRNLHSPVGTPPYSHVSGANPPFKMFRFEPRNWNMSVIIGMVGFGGPGPPVPGLQEHGGSAGRLVFKKIGYRTLKRRFKNPRQGGVITKKVRTNVRYPKRPFMDPALKATIPKLPMFWKNSLI